MPRFRDIVNSFDRRRFLQLMAASMALGGLSGCGNEANPRQLLPYVEAAGKCRSGAKSLLRDGDRPRADMRPASSYRPDGARPIKVEGNPDHPASLGAASAIMQASILEMYDPRRAQTIVGAGEIATWENFVAVLHGAATLDRAQRRRVFAFSPARPGRQMLAAQMANLQQQFPGHALAPMGAAASRQ